MLKFSDVFFHWSQAVLRKLRNIGLQTDYCNDSDVHNFCRKIFALPFLPSPSIPSAFANAKLQELVSYVGYILTGLRVRRGPYKLTNINLSPNGLSLSPNRLQQCRPMVLDCRPMVFRPIEVVITMDCF